MNKLIFFLLLLIGLSVKAQDYNDLGLILNPPNLNFIKEENFVRIDVEKDTLYVYMKIYSDISYNGQITEQNVRDVYTIVNGEMTKIRREKPTYKEVKKTIIELKEVWQ